MGGKRTRVGSGWSLAALLLVVAVATVACGSPDVTGAGSSVTTTVAPSPTPSPTGSPVILSGLGPGATPFPLASTAALPNAEAAIARARAWVSAAPDRPWTVVRVRLMTFPDELADEVAHSIAIPAYHLPPTPIPVWQVELFGPGDGAPWPCAGTAAVCPAQQDHELIVLNAADGSVLRVWGVGTPSRTGSPALATPVGGDAGLPLPPTIPVGARLPTIDAALVAGHRFASGPHDRPARAIEVRLVELRQTWDASQPGLPATTPVWLVTLDEAEVGHSCPAGAPPSACAPGTLATIIFDAATGWVVANAIG